MGDTPAVSQRDRDAAAKAIWHGEFSDPERVEEAILNGGEDNHAMVQAFHEHVSGLAEALKDARTYVAIDLGCGVVRGEEFSRALLARIDAALAAADGGGDSER